jgi:hypothetical protein
VSADLDRTFRLELDKDKDEVRFVVWPPPTSISAFARGEPLVMVMPPELALDMAKNIILAFGGGAMPKGEFIFQMGGNGGAKA